MTDGREEKVRKTDQLISRAIELWPLWLALLGGAVTAINFYNKVNDLVNDQKAWKGTTDQRRAETLKEMSDLKIRVSVAENDISWLKRGK